MERLREKAAAFGIALSDHQLEQFEMYYKMLVEKNKVMNLTAITEKNEVIDKHFADSLALVKSGVELKDQKILDACPIDDGLIFDNFCFASIRKLPTSS